MVLVEKLKYVEIEMIKVKLVIILVIKVFFYMLVVCFIELGIL